MYFRSGYLGILVVIGLMGLTLYMAFAFPFTLFSLKQKDTSELKSVIIVGRSGERSPTLDSYFIGESPPAELESLGSEQLTNVGKERMYLLGKFLKLRYYSLLLDGNPRNVYARSADTDRALESSQALLAGLNPPKDEWIWSTTGEFLNWQPKAIHTNSPSSDDLLSPQPNCPRLELDNRKWKNSTKYQQLLNEFRHDLQTLRSNTGLEFEEDLEMLSNIQDSLEARKGCKDSAPTWYTNTFANRLSHIVDVTTESHYSSQAIQRLYVGRLLFEISRNINNKIREDEHNTKQQVKDQAQAHAQALAIENLKSSAKTPNVIVYMTNKEQLAALLNSLQIYSNQPTFGALLLIELHYSPVDQKYFLRLFTVSSSLANVFPEPLRVNPIACADSVECEPQQFQQNIRHLMMDGKSWLEACVMIPETDSSTIPAPVPVPVPIWSQINSKDDSSSEKTLNQMDSITTTTESSSPTTTQQVNNTLPSEPNPANIELDKMDNNLIVGPTHLIPTEQPEEIAATTAKLEVTTSTSMGVLEVMTTTATSSGQVILATTTSVPQIISTRQTETLQTESSSLLEPSSTKRMDQIDIPDKIQSNFAESAIFQPNNQL